MITDYVVPGSAKKLNVPEKDNLTIWKVNIFTEKLEDYERHEEEDDDEMKKKMHQNEKKKNQTTVQ